MLSSDFPPGPGRLPIVGSLLSIPNTSGVLVACTSWFIQRYGKLVGDKHEAIYLLNRKRRFARISQSRRQRLQNRGLLRDFEIFRRFVRSSNIYRTACLMLTSHHPGWILRRPHTLGGRLRLRDRPGTLLPRRGGGPSQHLRLDVQV